MSRRQAMTQRTASSSLGNSRRFRRLRRASACTTPAIFSAWMDKATRSIRARWVAIRAPTVVRLGTQPADQPGQVHQQPRALPAADGELQVAPALRPRLDRNQATEMGMNEVAFGGVRNDANTRLPLNTGTQRVGGSVFDADPRAMLVGVRHDF